MDEDSSLRIHRCAVKQALRKGNLSDTFVVGKYRFSPYMACAHGCAYCDGRAERYYVEGDFDRDIVVRPNLPDLLEIELPKLREKGFITIGSGISDSYQPAEEDLCIMSGCAEVLTRFSYPVTIMTKSSLALRDLDLWSKVAAGPGFMFLVSLTFTDDDLRQVFEPGASPVSDRIQALRLYKQAGCHTGILAMPLLPWITDTDENIQGLFDIAEDVGADFIMPGGLTLRPGRQKQFFLRRLRETFPHLEPPYLDIYRENRRSGNCINSYSRDLISRCAKVNLSRKIPFLVPHHVYRGRLHKYDEVGVLMRHMIELYDAREVRTDRLKRSVRKYIDWIEEKKAVYNRRRSLRYDQLDEELRQAARSGELLEVLKNEKLTEFLTPVITEDAKFDYVDLTLS